MRPLTLWTVVAAVAIFCLFNHAILLAFQVCEAGVLDIRRIDRMRGMSRQVARDARGRLRFSTFARGGGLGLPRQAAIGRDFRQRHRIGPLPPLSFDGAVGDFFRGRRFAAFRSLDVASLRDQAFGGRAAILANSSTLISVTPRSCIAFRSVCSAIVSIARAVRSMKRWRVSPESVAAVPASVWLS